MVKTVAEELAELEAGLRGIKSPPWEKNGHRFHRGMLRARAVARAKKDNGLARLRRVETEDQLQAFLSVAEAMRRKLTAEEKQEVARLKRKFARR